MRCLRYRTSAITSNIDDRSNTRTPALYGEKTKGSLFEIDQKNEASGVEIAETMQHAFANGRRIRLFGRKQATPVSKSATDAIQYRKSYKIKE